MKINEPAVDLCVAASILSSYKDINIGQHAAFFGEVGLTGEIRKIVYMEQRIRECTRLGIQRNILPERGRTDGWGGNYSTQEYPRTL